MAPPSLQADDLILFAHIVDAGGLTRASDLIGIPKATLSRRLSRLENTLGERLLQRSTRHMAVTEFGERMLEHARRLSDEREEAAALASDRQAEPRGTLRVSLPPDFRQLPMVEMITRFVQRYPDITLDLDLSARRVDLIAERFDVVLRAASQLPDDRTLVARRISTQPSGLYASSSYLKRHGTPDTPSALLDHMGLVLAARGETQPWRLSHNGRRWEGLPRRTLAANSLDLLQELAVRGLGIVELTDRFARNAIRYRQLQRVLPDWGAPPVTLWCVTAGRRLLSKRSSAFIEALRTTLGDAQSETT